MRFYFGEQGYLELLKDLRNDGLWHPDRTDVGECFKLFSPMLAFDMQDGFPVHTLRLVGPRLGFEEFWAFLNGVVDIHPHLSAKNVNFWKGNTTRDFLDSRGLKHLPVGHIGKGYSFQYRNFGGDYTELSKREGSYLPDFSTGFDQIKALVDGLISDPFARRHLVSIWNPQQTSEMTLPPCYWAHQFVPMRQKDGSIELNLKVFSRSSDSLLGLPSNYSQFAIYLCAISKLCGYKPRYLIIDMTDSHIYGNQLDYIDELIEERTPSMEMGSIEINKELSTFEDFLSLTWDDIEIKNAHVNREPLKTPLPKMAV